MQIGPVGKNPQLDVTPALRYPNEFLGKSHENRAHYYRMKNVTLSADEHLIERAREVARSRHKTLNAAFREWLEEYTAQAGSAQEYDALMERLRYVRPGRKFTRDEMNER